jgi:hypothetical protein
MSYGRRNSYGVGAGSSYGGGRRGQSNFGGPKPIEIGKEYDKSERRWCCPNRRICYIC